MAAFPMVINGINARTSEALYQACRFPELPELQLQILSEYSPITAKRIGRPYISETRPDWLEVNVNIMRWCLRVKLAWNWTKFHAILMATKDLPIVEKSYKDSFWGAIPTHDGSTLIGKNVLGRLLMELREKVRNQEHDSFKRVEPLDIPRFLIDGEPIGTVVAP